MRRFARFCTPSFNNHIKLHDYTGVTMNAVCATIFTNLPLFLFVLSTATCFGHMTIIKQYKYNSIKLYYARNRMQNPRMKIIYDYNFTLQIHYFKNMKIIRNYQHLNIVKVSRSYLCNRPWRSIEFVRRRGSHIS
jgi:hypothetical protein